MPVPADSFFRIFTHDVREILRRFYENRHERITAHFAADFVDQATLDRLLALELLEYDPGEGEYRLDGRLESFFEEMLGTAEVAQADWLGSLLEELRRLIGACQNLGDLTGFAALDPETRTRADLARLAGDTKALPTNPLDGIFLRLSGAAELHGKPLNSTPEGCAHFILASELPHLSASTPLWIGVENAESFLRFESCRRHFPDFDFRHAAIVWRWSWGGKWQAWLRERAGKLIWFPDYDPAGLVIFSSQILSCRPDVQLLVPNDLDELLEHGSRKLFLRQESMLDSLPADREVQAVASRIKRVRKALEHEMLITPRDVTEQS